MEDQEIVELFWKRQETAIKETDRKYRKYLLNIAGNILKYKEDQEEILNDTYLATWNSIPTDRPQYLNLYEARIIRNKAINRYYKDNTRKNGGKSIITSISEMEQVLEDTNDPEQTVIMRELTKEIESFLRQLSKLDRQLFVRRYWYLDPLGRIAEKYNMTNGGVRIRLYRTRNKLRDYLKERGYHI